MDPDLLLAGLQAGNTAALARAISVVENARPGFERLLAEVHACLGRARRLSRMSPTNSRIGPRYHKSSGTGNPFLSLRA
jgi:hypothetical protein